jgi:hypothetical protein
MIILVIIISSAASNPLSSSATSSSGIVVVAAAAATIVFVGASLITLRLPYLDLPGDLPAIFNIICFCLSDLPMLELSAQLVIQIFEFSGLLAHGQQIYCPFWWNGSPHDGSDLIIWQCLSICHSLGVSFFNWNVVQILVHFFQYVTDFLRVEISHEKVSSHVLALTLKASCHPLWMSKALMASSNIS